VSEKDGSSNAPCQQCATQTKHREVDEAAAISHLPPPMSFAWCDSQSSQCSACITKSAIKISGVHQTVVPRGHPILIVRACPVVLEHDAAIEIVTRTPSACAGGTQPSGDTRETPPSIRMKPAA